MTCERLPEGTADDALAAKACVRRGLDVASVPWDDERVRWEGFDVIIVRSAWTYHRKPALFDAWLDRVAGHDLRVFNPVPLLRWNSCKSYLFELEKAGVSIIPAIHLDTPGSLDREVIASSLGTLDIVAKPLVGASALGVRRAKLDRPEDLEELASALEEGPLLIQSYVPEVATRGEWSLVYFAGTFSHAVIKAPGSGEFRVQQALGGTIRPADPPDTIRRFCEETLSALDLEPLYARVDVVEGAIRPLLVELEVIEPVLFFAEAPGSATRFAEAVCSVLGD